MVDNYFNEMQCCVCGKIVYKYVYHMRLGAAICATCPLTNVMGEDITGHTLLFVGSQRPVEDVVDSRLT